MARQRSPIPTERELSILGILWELVNEAMDKDGTSGYTTTLKLMQIMTEKGLLLRDDSQFKHIYRPAISEERTQNQLVGDLLDKAFAGSAEKLVMRALSAKKVSAKELGKIKKILAGYKGIES